ncbi:MAG: hypothetical protein HOP19_25395 [Acidobacteria bacterium]|nr:hypothetical protein [Acidobacteriota bacterium]
MFAAFFYGTKRASRSLKLLASLFAFNLLFALPLMIPIFSVMQLTTTNRLAARELMADQLNPIWFVDLINDRLTNGSLIAFATETFIQLYVIAGLYLLFNLMLTGGILGHLLHDTGRFSMRRFWAFGGAYFWRFFRLLCYAAPFYGLVFFAYNLANRFIARGMSRATALGAYPWYKLAAFAALVLGLALVNMIFDYARIHTVKHEVRGMWRATLAGATFAARNLHKTYPLYLFIAGLGFGLYVALTWFRDSVIQDSMFAVGIATAFGHVALVTKLWAKLSLATAQCRFYEAQQIENAMSPAPAEPAFEFRSATSDLLDHGVLTRAQAAFAEPVKPVANTAPLALTATNGSDKS